MWSNSGSNGGGSSRSSSRRNKSFRRNANVKGFLGGFATLDEEQSQSQQQQQQQQQQDDVSIANASCDMSSLGGFSALETDQRHFGSDRHINTVGSSQHHPSVLVEIPENFPRELDGETGKTQKPQRKHHQSNSGSDASGQSPNSIISIEGEDVSIATATHIISQMKQRQNERAATKDDSAAIVEIEKNLDDMDTYLLSIYMNDSASIYTKATTDSSFSSSSSVSSSYSTRQRHHGAHRNRRRCASRQSPHSPQQRQQQSNKGSWVDSMRAAASTNYFVEGDGGWTPRKGWQIKPKKTWDPEPDDRWNDGLNVFDAVQAERLEI